uniref:Uncharacterized protein n=1 Tax=Arundo donax TaxID=35708 RepID=A0A0A9EQ07_ARUDO
MLTLRLSMLLRL